LHTMAAYYPDAPTVERKQNTDTFLRSFATVYPCNVCAEDFAQQLQRYPPRLESRREFSRWMCDVHNNVNEQLGKPKFDCEQVDRRWRRAFTAAHTSTNNDTNNSQKK
jgi:FAD-linked sulfhydryl oxidase